MATREDTERTAAEIIEAIRREFPGATARLDFDSPRDEHEDAYLWISAGTDDAEEIREVWGYAIKLVQDAYQEADVYIVARMPGVGVIDRERPADQAF